MNPFTDRLVKMLSVVSFLVVLSSLLSPAGALAQEKTAPPKPLPPDIVAAWQKAEASVGWMSTRDFSMHFQGEPKEDELPAFRIKFWKAGVIAQLPQPQTAFGLDQGETAITDGDLKDLAKLKNLQVLDLYGTGVTPAGLKHLAELKSLKALHIWGKASTDAGLKEVAGMNTLETLRLGSQITNAGLKHLGGLKNLQVLDIGYTQVTDAGLKELTGLKNLQQLNLNDTKVTDAGLKELAEVKSLQKLDLSRSKVTDAGVKELQKSLPNLKVYRN